MTTPGTSASPSTEEAIGIFVRSFLQNVHTAMPARVVKYNATEQTVDVQPLVQRLIETIEGGELAEALPIIPDVPLAFPRSSRMFLSFPMAEGDLVMLVFQMRSIDRFFQGQGSRPENSGDFRLHDLADAVAYPGLYTASRAIKDIDTENAVLGEDEGGVQIRVGGGEVNITINGDASSPVALADALSTLWGQLETWLAAHTHTSAAPASPTSPPVQAATVPAFDSAVESAVLKVGG